MTENVSNPIILTKQSEQSGQNAEMSKSEMFKAMPGLLWKTLKLTFTYKGRATRLEFWSFVITTIILNLILSIFALLFGLIHENLAIPFISLLSLIDFCLFFTGLAISVRRLHDLSLTGLWLLYLSQFGLPIVFMVNILNIDTSCNSVMEKISKACSNWVSWLLLPLFWFFGAPTALFLLMLYKGKDEENEFGPSPYAK